MIPIRTYIFKRRSQGKQTSWRVRWKDPKSGRWKSVTGGRSKDEAKIIESQVRQDLLRGVDPTASAVSEDNWTVSQVIEAFLGHSRYLSGTEKWRHEAKMKIDNDFLPQLGKLRFQGLDSDRVYKFYLGLKNRGLTHSTIEKYHHLFRIIGDIYSEKVPDSTNPLRRIRDFRKRFPKQASSRDINFLSPDELVALFQETKKSRGPILTCFAKFQATTGLRRSEALNLKWTDVDEVAKQIHVRMSKSGKSRTFPLEPQAFEAIQELKGFGAYVFTKSDGTRYHSDSLLRPLQRAARRAGIHKRIDIHTLRHSYGSNKLRQGWGLKKVSVLLGHADISTTANIYAHLLDGDLRIRDDARLDFDKNIESKQSVRSEESDEKMAQMIAKAITKNLAGSQEGRLALGDLLRALSTTSSLMQPQVPARSVEILRDLQKGSNSSSHAPLMLHTSGSKAPKTNSAPNSGSDVSVSLQEVGADFKMEPMIRIERTTYALRKRCSTD